MNLNAEKKLLKLLLKQHKSPLPPHPHHSDVLQIPMTRDAVNKLPQERRPNALQILEIQDVEI